MKIKVSYYATIEVETEIDSDELFSTMDENDSEQMVSEYIDMHLQVYSTNEGDESNFVSIEQIQIEDLDELEKLRKKYFKKIKR